MEYPQLVQKERIPHYHGDTVRLLFLITVGLTFLVVPIWGHVVPFGTLFEVMSGIILIALAGLTNPHSRWVMTLNVLASGIGAFLLEYSAISFQATDTTTLLIMREAAAFILIVAFYFSVKTLRAMTQGKVGELSRPWEFEKVDSNKE